MKLFDPKREWQIKDINAIALTDADFIARCELEYDERVHALADEIIADGCGVVMASGPSASGKTTSSLRIARELGGRGVNAIVISLDDFFKNIEDYPKKDDGAPDLENVRSLDLELINDTIEKLLRDRECELPQFDFASQRRKSETKHIKLPAGSVAIIEGIHALNPLLTEKVEASGVMNLYIGLRIEFLEDRHRIVATRDLRITRRLVRDFLFRGYSVERTLSVWRDIVFGEDRWIKPFKKRADYLLDTSFEYEPCVFRPIMQRLHTDPDCGGAYRETFVDLCERLEHFEPLAGDAVPKDAILREFIGGLEL